MAAWPLALLLQAAAPTAPDGVIAYPPAFFAGQQPNNAREMLERLPGFVLDYGATVRGLEGAAGNVLIDGRRPASKTDGLYDILTRIPAGKVARIDVVRGGAPGLDMQGRSVVANVVLKADAERRVQMVGTTTKPLSDGRTGGSAEVQASGGGGGRTWEASTELSHVVVGLPGDGPGLVLAPGAAPRRSFVRTEHDGTYLLSTGKVEQSAAGGRLRLNGRLFLDKQKVEEDDAELAASAGESTDQVQRTDEWELGAGFDRKLGGGRALELTALSHATRLDYAAESVAEDRQRFELDQRVRETVGRAVVKQQWGEAWSAEAGGEAARNTLASRTRFEIDGQALPLPAGDVRVGETRVNGFAKASWTPTPAWSADAALAYERSRLTAEGDVALEKTLAYVKPRLAASWSPRPATQIRARIEREVGQLDFDDFVAQADLNTDTGVTAGNPDLAPERAWTAEAVLEQRFWGWGALTLTVSRSALRDVVDRGPVFTETGVFDRPANIGSGRRDLARLDLTLPLGPLGLEGGQLKGFVVRRWSRVDDPTTGARRPISGLRPVEWEAHVTQDLPARGVTWGVSAYGGWQEAYYRFNAVERLKLDPFVMVFVEWRPRPDLDVRAELENITERGRRQTTVTWPGPRDAGGAATVRDRDPHFGRLVYLRVRKRL